MKVTNQLPGPLPVLSMPADTDWDIDARIRELVVDPITRPLTAGTPASILTDAGEVVEPDQIAELATRALGFDSTTRLVDLEPNEVMLELGAATLANYHPLDAGTSSSFDFAPAVQAAGRLRWPLPSGKKNDPIMYTIADVVDGATSILGAHDAASLAEGIDKLSAGLAFTVAGSVDTFVITVDTWDAFDAVRASLRATTANSPWLSTEIVDKLEALASLKVTQSATIEAVKLRAGYFDDVDPLGFARIAVETLTTVDGVHIVPLRLGQMITPTAVTIVCLDSTAHADPATIAEDWRLLTSRLARASVISLKDITGLVTEARNTQRAMAMSGLRLRNDTTARADRVAFSKTQPSKADMIRAMITLINHAKSVAISHNLTKSRRTSFTRASRRDPMNHNVPGRTQRVDYLPDLHVYVDTSGSMSEDDYRAAVQAIIGLAKRLNVDLYFSSFSHYLSEETLVKTSKMNSRQMWKAISALPKVTGGTNFQNVWANINASKARRKRINVMITDFEWYPSISDGPHPKNLFYLPATNMPWDVICDSAKEFAKACTAIDPNIANRFIAMR